MPTLPWMALCFAFILGVTGCEFAPSEQRVSGTYSGALNGATETLMLHADGSLRQELRLPSGRTITSAGRWRLEEKLVILYHYQQFYDEMQGGALIEPREFCSVNYIWGADMLIRDWGSGYYTLKHQ